MRAMPFAAHAATPFCISLASLCPMAGALMVNGISRNLCLKDIPPPKFYALRMDQTFRQRPCLNDWHTPVTKRRGERTDPNSLLPVSEANTLLKPGKATPLMVNCHPATIHKTGHWRSGFLVLLALHTPVSKHMQPGFASTLVASARMRHIGMRLASTPPKVLF